MLSAELLEILWDGVCGSEKSGIMRQTPTLKPSEAKLILFTAVVPFMQQQHKI